MSGIVMRQAENQTAIATLTSGTRKLCASRTCGRFSTSAALQTAVKAPIIPPMPEMTPQAFIEKWRAARLKESAAYSEHFCDLCHMLGQPTPAAADPAGDFFTFQKGVTKNAAGAEVYVDTLFGEQPVKAAHAQGFADVWFKGHFAWEYKGKHKDLEKAD